MANVVVTLKIMPDSPEVDLVPIEKSIKKKIKKFSDHLEFKTSIEPVAFGINSLNITFVMDESKGSTESLEKEIRNMEGISSVEVSDVRRAIG